ncbi:MAG TPA: GIY-YIG nuclease family protein [Bacteroidales bacterium]|nr:GIY-YIG nuclease family protein [Bacteroidales bacterium]
MPYTYIIYSHSADRFYIGSTADDLQQRIRKHNSHHRGFTARANDWGLVYCEKFESIQQARSRERQIKAWKNRKRIEVLCGFSKP